MPEGDRSANIGKFIDPLVTADGQERAHVTLAGLKTLWVNTGSLCNIECAGCYMGSSPRNDALVWFRHNDLVRYLDEIAAHRLPTEEIGFTGGEPFMNPDIIAMLTTALERGYRVLVLTNAMKPMTHKRPALLDLHARFGDRLAVRVSLDHYSKAEHEHLRGPGAWDIALDGLRWLAVHGFNIAVAGRTLWGEPEETERAGYHAMLRAQGIALDTGDPTRLVLFPEMDPHKEVPEITTACWGLLGKRPADVMCAHSRMVIRRKGASGPAVVACTLLPYDPRFELGATLAEAASDVALNHPYCATFCVLGGASCSA